MLWISIVSYFNDSSRFACMYGILTLIILKESIDNKKVTCIDDKEAKVTRDVNEICKKQLLFKYTHESISLKNIIIMDWTEKKKCNVFTKDNNYFIVSYVHGFHVIVTLGTVGISPPLLPNVFYLRNKKTSSYFYELECINYHNVYYLFSLIDAINQTSNAKSNNRDIYQNIAFGKQVIYIDPFY